MYTFLLIYFCAAIKLDFGDMRKTANHLTLLCGTYSFEINKSHMAHSTEIIIHFSGYGFIYFSLSFYLAHCLCAMSDKFHKSCVTFNSPDEQK